MQEPRQEVWGFELNEQTEQRYNWPFVVKVLSVQMGKEMPFLVALVRPESPLREYKIMCFQVGRHVYGNSSYLGTVQTKEAVLCYFAGGPGL